MSSISRHMGLFIAVSLFLTACGDGRAVLRYGVNATPSSVAAAKAAHSPHTMPKAIIPVYIATSRGYQNSIALPFGIKRSPELHFALAGIGIPPTHQKGMVEKNGNKPDPGKHFTAVSFGLYNSRQSFKNALNTALARSPGKNKEIFLFIHGYNNNFAESTFRAAQIAYDYKLDSVTVHYAWPSGGALSLYIYDKDSADFARDGLADLLQLLTQTHANQITVVAHSMGNYVTMEAMRTLSLKGQHQVIDHISNFLMAAPDIDVDVFEKQLKDIKQLPRKTIVQVSNADTALTISRKITGGHARVGDGSNIDFLRRHGISVLDMSRVDGGPPGVFASSPTLMTLIQEGALSHSVLTGDGERPGDAILADGSSVLKGATSLILYAPLRLLSSVTSNRLGR